MPVTHAKVSGIAPVADTTLVRSNDWNDAHIVNVNVLTESQGGTAGSVLFISTAPGGGITQDNANFFYDDANNRFNVKTNGDQTGTDAINVYYQIDSYLPQSAMGAVNTANIPGFTASSSAGTAASPVRLSAGNLIGGFGMWGYTGVSPAYVPMAGIYAVVTGTSNDKGGDLYLYQKHDNNTGYYNTWQFRSDGALVSPPGTGFYAHNGIMVSQNDGVFLSGTLDRNDTGYFGNVLQLAHGGLGNSSDYGNGVPLQYTGDSTTIQGASRVQFTTNITGWDLTLGYPGGTYYNCLQMYPGYSGIAIQSIDYNSGNPNFNLDYFGQIKANDPYSTRQGHVFAPNAVNPVVSDGTINTYQAGSGDYWNLWLDKSDVVKGSYTDSLLDVMDASFNTNKNITCLNIQASNTIIGNSASIAGQCGAGNITATSSIEMLNATTRLYVKEGTSSSSGKATLIAGTKAITITGLSTASRARVQLETTGGTLGAAYKAVCTANTLTITSVTAAGATQTLDTSTLNYFIHEAT